MRLGDATLRDDFDRVGYTGLGVSGFIAASEAPLERRSCITDLGAPEWPGRVRRAPLHLRQRHPRAPTHLAQQATLGVGTAAERVSDEATRIRRPWPGQHLRFRPWGGTGRRPRAGGGRGRGSRAREGARRQEAGGGLHADGAAQSLPSWFSVPPGPGRAWRCLVSLRCDRARAGGSLTFLSMNPCPLPGVSSSRAPPLSWQPGLQRPRPLLRLTSAKRSSPCLGVLKGHSSCSGLKGAPVELVAWQV